MSDFEETPMTEKDWKKMKEAGEEGLRRQVQWKKEQEEMERKAGHKLPPHLPVATPTAGHIP